MASTSDTDEVLNQILRGGSAGSSLRKLDNFEPAICSVGFPVPAKFLSPAV